MLEKQDIAEFRKYKDCQTWHTEQGSHEICIWHIEYRLHNDNEWYDLFDDPPEWAVDTVLKTLQKKTKSA